MFFTRPFAKRDSFRTLPIQPMSGISGLGDGSGWITAINADRTSYQRFADQGGMATYSDLYGFINAADPQGFVDYVAAHGIDRDLFQKWVTIYYQNISPEDMPGVTAFFAFWDNPFYQAPVAPIVQELPFTPDRGLTPAPAPFTAYPQGVIEYLIPLAHAGYGDDFRNYLNAWNLDLRSALHDLLAYGYSPMDVQNVLYFYFLGTEFDTSGSAYTTALDMYLNAGQVPTFAPSGNTIAPTGQRVAMPMPDGTQAVSNPDYSLNDTDPNSQAYKDAYVDMQAGIVAAQAALNPPAPAPATSVASPAPAYDLNDGIHTGQVIVTPAMALMQGWEQVGFGSDGTPLYYSPVLRVTIDSYGNIVSRDTVGAPAPAPVAAPAPGVIATADIGSNGNPVIVGTPAPAPAYDLTDYYNEDGSNPFSPAPPPIAPPPPAHRHIGALVLAVGAAVLLTGGRRE